MLAARAVARKDGILREKKWYFKTEKKMYFKTENYLNYVIHLRSINSGLPGWMISDNILAPILNLGQKVMAGY